MSPYKPRPARHRATATAAQLLLLVLLLTLVPTACGQVHTDEDVDVADGTVSAALTINNAPNTIRLRGATVSSLQISQTTVDTVDITIERCTIASLVIDGKFRSLTITGATSQVPSVEIKQAVAFGTTMLFEDVNFLATTGSSKFLVSGTVNGSSLTFRRCSMGTINGKALNFRGSFVDSRLDIESSSFVLKTSSRACNGLLRGVSIDGAVGITDWSSEGRARVGIALKDTTIRATGGGYCNQGSSRATTFDIVYVTGTGTWPPEAIVLHNTSLSTSNMYGSVRFFGFPATDLRDGSLSGLLSETNDVSLNAGIWAMYFDVNRLSNVTLAIAEPIRWHPASSSEVGYTIVANVVENSNVTLSRGSLIDSCILWTRNGFINSTFAMRDGDVLITEFATIHMVHLHGGLQNSRVHVANMNIRIVARSPCNNDMRVLSLEGAVTPDTYTLVEHSNMTVLTDNYCNQGQTRSTNQYLIHVTPVGTFDAKSQIHVRYNRITSASRNEFNFLRLWSVISVGFDRETLETNMLDVSTHRYAAFLRVLSLVNATVEPTPGLDLIGTGQMATNLHSMWLWVEQDAISCTFRFRRVTSPSAVIWISRMSRDVLLHIEDSDINIRTAATTRLFYLGDPAQPSRDVRVVLLRNNLTSFSSAPCNGAVYGLSLPFGAAAQNISFTVDGNRIFAKTTAAYCNQGVTRSSTAYGLVLSVPDLNDIDFSNNRFEIYAAGDVIGIKVEGTVDGANLERLTQSGNTYYVRSTKRPCYVIKFSQRVANTSLIFDGAAQPGLIQQISRCGHQPALFGVDKDAINFHLVVRNMAINHSIGYITTGMRRSTITVSNTTVRSIADYLGWAIIVGNAAATSVGLADRSTIDIKDTNIALSGLSVCNVWNAAIYIRNDVDDTSTLRIAQTSIHTYGNAAYCNQGTSRGGSAFAIYISASIDLDRSWRVDPDTVTLYARASYEVAAIWFETGTVRGTLLLPKGMASYSHYGRNALLRMHNVADARVEFSAENVLQGTFGHGVLFHGGNLKRSHIVVRDFPSGSPARAIYIWGTVSEGSTILVTDVHMNGHVQGSRYARFVHVGTLDSGSVLRIRNTHTHHTFSQVRYSCGNGIYAMISNGRVKNNSVIEYVDSSSTMDTRQRICTSNGKPTTLIASVGAIEDSRVTFERLTLAARSARSALPTRLLRITGDGILTGAELEVINTTARVMVGVELKLVNATRTVVRGLVVEPDSESHGVTMIWGYQSGHYAVADSSVTTAKTTAGLLPLAERTTGRLIYQPPAFTQPTAPKSERQLYTRCNYIDTTKLTEFGGLTALATHAEIDCTTCSLFIDCNPAHALAVSGTAPDACVCRCPDVPLSQKGKMSYDDRCNLRELSTTATKALTPSLERTRSLTPPREPTATVVLPPSATLERTASVMPTPTRDPGAPPTDPPETPTPVPPTPEPPAPVERTQTAVVPPPTPSQSASVTPLPPETPAPPPRTPSETMTLPLPPPPPPPPVKSRTAKALGTVVDEESAEAVSSSANTAAAIGGATSATSATKASNMANIVGAAECEFEPEEDLEVSPMEVLFVWSIGTSPFAQLLGPIVSTNLIAFFPHVVSLILHFTAQPYKKTRLAVGMLSPMIAGYLLPTTTSLATLVLSHHHTEPFERYVFGGGGLLFALGVGFLPAIPIYAVLKSGVPIDEDGKQVWPGETSYLLALRYFYDVVRDVEKPLVLLSYFEDLGIAMLMSVVASAKIPGVDCRIIAILLSLLAVLHVAYLAVLRPFRPRIDSGFAYLVGGLQAIVAIAVVVSLFHESSLSLVGYLALALGASFMLQTVVMLIWTAVQLRRRSLRAARRARLQAKQQLERPLLADVPTSAAVGRGRGVPSHGQLRFAKIIPPSEAAQMPFGKASNPAGDEAANNARNGNSSLASGSSSNGVLDQNQPAVASTGRTPSANSSEARDLPQVPSSSGQPASPALGLEPLASPDRTAAAAPANPLGNQ